MRRIVLCVALSCAAVLVVARDGRAQVAIAGVVKDATGALLPGVTVEASSPALIEKSRTVLTDGAGQYKIVDLSPGTYDVTFSLSGFKNVRRSGIVLEGSFTAQVNADLEVGSVEETVTVAGYSPTIDVVNTATTSVLNRDVLDSIPTAIRNTPGRALLLPGTQVTFFVLGQYNVSVHGSATSDFTIAVDGMRVNNLCGSGQYSGFYMNDAAIQELTYLTGAESAEVQSSGLRVNSVPKEGGNKFSGTFFLEGVGSGLHSDNRSDALKKILAQPPGIAFDWQINPSFGGPIAKDKLWFYATYKYQDAKNFVASTYADGSPAYRRLMGNYSAIGRLTWAMTSKDKIRAYVERQDNGEFFNGFATYVNVSPEAASDAWGGGWVPQIKWTEVASQRLLIDAGISYYYQPYWQRDNSLSGPRDLSRFELTTGRVTGAAGFVTPTYSSWTHDYSSAASVSYVTGSHAFKTGMTMLWGTNSRTNDSKAQISRLVFNAGQPVQAVVANSPSTAVQKVDADFGTYVQDSWTLRRLTLNLGARFDYFNAEVPAESSPAALWIQARDFPAIKNVPNWKDWATRTAVSYDLFGTGRTAVKVTAGKYLAAQAAGYAATFNGMSSSTQTRTWTDLNGDKTILNADGSIQLNEVIGGTSNFGQITSYPDDKLKRGYNWEYSALVEHELVPRFRVSGGYYRRKFYNLSITDNLNLDPNTDWTPFTITIPNDSRLPNAGQAVTMYTLNQNKVGVATYNLRTYSAGTYGPNNFSTYNGVEATFNARLNKFIGFGGLTTERSTTTSCDEPDSPNSRRFCDAPGRLRTTFKASAAYQLPWDIQVSGNFLARPGPSLSATYTVTSAIAGRPIIGATSGSSTISLSLIEPNTQFLDYQNTLDTRMSKGFKFGRYRAQAYVDIFNIFNAGTVTAVNTTYGTAWLTPQAILQGRYVRFGTQWNF